VVDDLQSQVLLDPYLLTDNDVERDAWKAQRKDDQKNPEMYRDES
jgi:hypothetical protein